MLYAALSCLQGRPTLNAIVELAALPIDGIQLTPGCAPSDTRAVADALGSLAVRTHQGWTPAARRRRVWVDGTAELAVASDSVHPPRSAVREAFFAQAEAGHYGEQVFETMYPGYVLGSSSDIDRAIDIGLRLAVDVSHLDLMRSAGVLSARTLSRVLSYERISEIHVSRAEGNRDAHAPFEAGDYLVRWARERQRAGNVVVVECYLHRLDAHQRDAVFSACL